MINIYQESEVMRFLGRLGLKSVMDQMQLDQVRDIIHAHEMRGKKDNLFMATDVYTLGYINGIRHERARRRAKQEAKKVREFTSSLGNTGAIVITKEELAKLLAAYGEYRQKANV